MISPISPEASGAYSVDRFPRNPIPTIGTSNQDDQGDVQD